MGFLSRFDPVVRAVRKHREGLRARAGLHLRSVVLPDDRSVVYLDAGSARPPMVMLHGIGASKDHWTRLARRLAGAVRVIAPDLPGFGDSDKTGDFAMTAQARAVLAFADALGLDRFHLAGSSMGGRIAAEVARLRPDRLRSLWLLAPAGAEGEQLSEMIEGLMAGDGVPLFARTAEEYTASVAFTMSRPPHIPGPALRVLAAESAEDHDRNMDIFAAISQEMRDRPSTEALLDGLDVPTLITWGEDDRVLHASGAATIAAAMPDATVRVHPGLGHLPLMEDPDATAADWSAFADAHGF